MAQWRHKTQMILINIVAGNSLLSDSTKPLPEPVPIYNKLWPYELILMKHESRCEHFP